MVNNVHKRRNRLTAAFILVSLIFFGLILRLLFIQVIDAEKYQTLATMQRTRDIPIPAMRGDILDRNGVKLAFSIKTFSIWVRPAELTDVELALDSIGSAVTIDRDAAAEKIASADGIVNIQRGLDNEEAGRIEALQLKGVWVTDDIQRVYPFDNFASHVIGHTTTDNVGIAGIEQSFNEELTGIPGKYLISTDASGRQLAFGTDKEFSPIDGYDVKLTIDQVIQHYLEKALEEAFQENLPIKVMGIIMDTRTGEILAMSSKPDYNLNEPRIPSAAYGAVDLDTMEDSAKVAFWSSMWRNPIVSSLYEPGSIFKLITAAAGLEESVVTPYTMFDAHGYLVVDGVRINCWSYRNPHGEQTLTEALENSCNPVFIETQTLLGKTVFYDYVLDFGFAEKTGIQLPAEASSLMIPQETLNNVEAATMSFGHGLSVTPLQMIRAIGAIANDGKMMQPYIVESVLDPSGSVIEQAEPKMLRQVISEKTSIEMRLMMESVVDNGSGANAQVKGIRLGGKTGTSEKIVDGAYSGDAVYASFAAIGPIDDPQLALLIVLDEPQFSTYGSVVAAPVAQAVLTDTFRYLGINPDVESAEDKVEVPDFNGMTETEVEKAARSAGVTVSFSDKGDDDAEWRVVQQYPMAGKRVDNGSMVIVRMDRWDNNEDEDAGQ